MMTKRVIDAQEFTTLRELSGIISYWLKLVELGELPSDAVVLTQNAGRITLVEEALSDGSTVVNLFVFPSSEDRDLASITMEGTARDKKLVRALKMMRGDTE